MKVGSDFPTSFKVHSEYGEEFEIRVEYGWRPRQCTVCNIFGHSTLSCPQNPAKVATPPSTKHALPTPRQIYQPKTKPGNIAPSHNPSNPLPSLPTPLPLAPQDTPLSDLSSANPFSSLDKGIQDSLEDGTVETTKEIVPIEDSMSLVVGLDPSLGLGQPTRDPSQPSLVTNGETHEGGIDPTIGFGQQAKEATTPSSADNGSGVVEATSDKEEEWTPVRWGKKRIIVDEFDKIKVRNSKGKKKKGSRLKS